MIADDDDFIVPSADDCAAVDGEPQSGAVTSGLLGWGGLTKFVFSKKAGGDPSGGADAATQEPSLPPGFSALLNAEEEEIYPAEVRGMTRPFDCMRYRFHPNRDSLDSRFNV